MDHKRVVITGIGAVSAFGLGADSLLAAVARGNSGVRLMPEWAHIRGLDSRLAAPVPEFDPRAHLPRSRRRTMGRLAIYAAIAAAEATNMAALDEKERGNGRTGIVIGSTTGSPEVYEDFYRGFLPDDSIEDVRSGTFFKIMGHTTAANVGQALGIRGEQWSPSSACTTSSQAMGLALMLIKSGRQDIVLCGGADEVHPTVTMVFDVIGAGARREGKSPAPFDRDRDGVVCGGGSGILVLESLASARRRGVKILAEISGFGHLTDIGHIANPDKNAMIAAMRQGLDESGTDVEEVDFVSAHATGTTAGDIAESRAIAALFGSRVPVASHKGHMGHTLAAAGALETIISLAMMKKNEIFPTLNLENPDPECGAINYAMKQKKTGINIVVKNNFALGGVNTSLVLKKING